MSLFLSLSHISLGDTVKIWYQKWQVWEKRYRKGVSNFPHTMIIGVLGKGFFIFFFFLSWFVKFSFISQVFKMAMIGYTYFFRAILESSLDGPHDICCTVYHWNLVSCLFCCICLQKYQVYIET